MRSAKILFVDDDPNILEAFHRQLRKQFTIETAEGGQSGLEAIAERGPFAVIVSDLRMPGMDGIQFLSHVRQTAVDSVRMMLTGNADLQTAIDAVNTGNIFRFLTKPCAPDALTNALTAGIQQYQLIMAERELLEKTLRGIIRVLSEILELINPEAFGRASRIAHYTKEIARQLRIAQVWKVETAALLSQIGCVILPETALKKIYQGKELTPEEKQLFDMHPFIGSDLIAHIPRMKSIAEIISNQEKHFDGSGGSQEEGPVGEDIPVGARILKVVLDFDTLQASGASKGEAFSRLTERTGWYDPAVVAALETIVGIEARYEERVVRLKDLMDEMILAEDVLIRDGRLLVARGYKVNRTLRERLKNFAEKTGIKEPIKVFVPVRG
jgi:response regulator RpfG family c-di-GMP phosphodiesterase